MTRFNSTLFVVADKMMWLDEQKKCVLDDTDDSDSSGEELPIWVRGEQRWISGVAPDTTCQDVIEVLLQDEQSRVIDCLLHFHVIAI